MTGKKETKEYYDGVFQLIVSESDRGALLLCLSQIDKVLGDLFKAFTPSQISENRRNDLFNYSGPFGTLAGKLNVALVCRILPLETVDAIQKLKKIRNDLAHEVESFNLLDHEKEIRDVINLASDDGYHAINLIAIESSVKRMLEILKKLDHPRDDSKAYFEDEQSALKHLRESQSLIGVMEESRPRYELAIGVGLIIDSIKTHKQQFLDTVGADETLYPILGKLTPDT